MLGVAFELQQEITELKEEIVELKDELSKNRNYSEALCRKLAERDAEIKVLREILFERSKTKNKTERSEMIKIILMTLLLLVVSICIFCVVDDPLKALLCCSPMYAGFIISLLPNHQ